MPRTAQMVNEVRRASWSGSCTSVVVLSTLQTRTADGMHTNTSTRGIRREVIECEYRMHHDLIGRSASLLLADGYVHG